MLKPYSGTLEVARLAGSPDSPLTIRLFGTPEVLVCGVPVPRLRTRKGLWLLALCVLRAPAEVDREWLAATLWPDSAERTALTNLRNVLMDLRRVLGPQASRLVSPTTRALTLDLSGARADVREFDACVARGDPDSVQLAVSLYRGPLLEECAEEWVFRERESREQAYLAALEAAAEHRIAMGDRLTAERYLREAVAVDSFRETAQRGLIRVLAAGGNHAAALLAYRTLCLRLRRELNTEPDPRTVALIEQVRGGQLLAQAGATEPCQEADSVRFGPISDAPPSNLPPRLSSFVGREAEVARLRELLAADGLRLLTLTGPGGVGKTRLAVQVAADLRHTLPEGVVFVDLAPIREPRRVIPTLARALGVEEVEGRPLQELLARYLQGKRMLLLLDNFEQVLEAATELPPLLAEAPAVKMLVTSRAALGLRGEQKFPVPPLPAPPAALGSELWALGKGDLDSDPPAPGSELQAAFPSVRLFVERAQAVRPDFVLTKANAVDVAAICRRLDGLPLAIELAAAQTRLFSPKALLSRTEGRLQWPTMGARDLPARQQTLRDTIAWSYDLLDEREQRLFRRLSVFVGGFTLESVRAVGDLAADEALDLLVSLVDQSLLYQLEAVESEARFGMLETLREFGAERLAESGEDQAARWEHARYLLKLAEQAGRSPAHRVQWLNRLEAEHDNLRQVLTWALEPHPPEDRDARLDLGLQLGANLSWFWNVRGHAPEARERLGALLARAGPAPRTAARAGALNALAGFTERPGEYGRARALIEESLAIHRERNDRRRMAGALYNLGRYAQNEGDGERAQRCFQESLELSREPGGDQGLAAANLLQFGERAREAGEFSTARVLLEESLAIRRELGDQWMVANAFQALGRLSAVEGDVEKARAELEASLRLMRELGARGGSAESLEELGLLCLKVGELEEAGRFLRETLTMRQELGDPRHLARGLRHLADLAVARGQPKKAARLLSAAEAHFEASIVSGSLGDLARRAALCAALGKEAYVRAWAEGQGICLEEAIVFALEERGAANVEGSNNSLVLSRKES
jgi:predicted ATPase/DNA-binding SARP family transcriptional activator